MAEGIVTNGIADVIVQIVHEPALLDGQNLVEGSSDMEPDAVHVVVSVTGCHLLTGEPSFVTASKLQFVSIFQGLHTAHNGAERRQFHLSDAAQLVFHLTLLGLELCAVGQILPFASTAHSEMLANGHLPHLTIREESHHLAFTITMLLFLQLNVHNIPGYTKGDKHHHIVNTCQGLALGSHVCNGYSLQKRQRFFLSTHTVFAIFLQK